jgi:PAS domain S-box-containing protein
MARIRWLVVFGSVMFDVLVRYGISRWVGFHFPFTIMFIGVFVSAIAAGFLGGLVATTLSLFACWYIFFPPELAVKVPDATGFLGLLLFFLEGLAISFFVGFFRKTTLAVGNDLFRAEAARKSVMLALSKSRAAESRMRELARSLNESEENFKLLLDGVKTYGIFFIDCDGVITSWSQGAERLTGFTDAEAIGRPISIIFTPEDIKNKVPDRELARAREFGIADDERWHQRKDGKKFWATGSVTPLTNDEGVIRGFAKIVGDATERKLGEEFRLHEKEWLESALNLLPVPMIFASAESGDIQFYNHTLQHIAGESPFSVNLPSGDLLFSSDGKKIQFSDWLDKRTEEFSEAKGIEAIWNVRQRFYNVLIFGEILHEMYGHARTIVLTISDITHQKKIEFELKQASEAKSQFLANMSHEIRTPLGAILGFTDLLKDSNLSNDERDRFAEIVAKNGKLLSQLINDILDLSKIESGSIQLENVEVPLSEMISEVAALFRRSAEKKGVSLKILPPDGDVPAKIYTDPMRLKQIFINMVSNALKFTHNGSITLKLCFIKAVDGGPNHIGFKVEDTGIGILPEKQKNLFQPFSQADASMTRKYGGTGLGLILSRKIAEVLQGDLILLRSAPDVGSSFLATFRSMAPARPVADVSPNAVIDQPSSKKPLKGKRVLLVEDSVDNQVLIKKYLAIEEAKLTICDNGESAVETASSEKFDLILMDIQLPIMDGYQATRKLRDLGVQTPIVALTAHALSEDLKKSTEAGCNGHLTKPIYRADLVREVEKVL